MKTFKLLAVTVAVLALISLAQAGSTRSSTVKENGKTIKTTIKTDNKGIATTTVKTTDQEGNVTTTTTVTDKDGKIISTDDPEAQAKADVASQQKKEKADALANAPKRGPSDPIQMALFQVEVSEELRKATTKEGIFPYLRKEFEKDPVIKLLDQSRVDNYSQRHDFKTGKSTSLSGSEAGLKYLPADIYVKSTAMIEEEYGISKTTKKLASAPYLVYKGTIHSEYTDQTWDVTEKGHILNNLEVTKKFADKIRAVVLNEAGAMIPADAAKFRRGTTATEGAAGAEEKQIDAGEALRNLFKKKK